MAKQDLAKNSRKHERISLKTRVNCLTEGRFLSDFSKNLSEGGICMQSLQEIKSGTVVDLQIHIPEQVKPLRIKGEVIWAKSFNSTPEVAGIYDLGIRFVDTSLESSTVIKSISPRQKKTKDN